MAWRAYTLTYQAMAPILLGTHPLGFIQRTRLYAPGWTLWGAITAQLTRSFLPRAEGRDYEMVGRFVEHNLPSSYAFVLVDDKAARPHFANGKLQYGALPAADFEARFLASLGQTGVAPATLSAHTGTLHETEVLVARDPENNGEPVRWQLILYARQPWRDPPPSLEGMEPQDVLDALANLTVGADRGYGLGRLVRENKEEVDQGKLTEDGEWTHALCWDPASKVLHAHVPQDQLPGDAVRGRLEAIPWRWWQNEPGDAWGPGQKREVRRFYAPGSQVDIEGWRPVVGPKGIWHEKGWRDAPAATS
jgi:hypothetical protein